MNSSNLNTINNDSSHGCSARVKCMSLQQVKVQQERKQAIKVSNANRIKRREKDYNVAMSNMAIQYNKKLMIFFDNLRDMNFPIIEVNDDAMPDYRAFSSMMFRHQLEILNSHFDVIQFSIFCNSFYCRGYQDSLDIKRIKNHYMNKERVVCAIDQCYEATEEQYNAIYEKDVVRMKFNKDKLSSPPQRGIKVSMRGKIITLMYRRTRNSGSLIKIDFDTSIWDWRDKTLHKRHFNLRDFCYCAFVLPEILWGRTVFKISKTENKKLFTYNNMRAFMNLLKSHYPFKHYGLCARLIKDVHPKMLYSCSYTPMRMVGYSFLISHPRLLSQEGFPKWMYYDCEDEYVAQVGIFKTIDAMIEKGQQSMIEDYIKKQSDEDPYFITKVLRRYGPTFLKMGWYSSCNLINFLWRGTWSYIKESAVGKGVNYIKEVLYDLLMRAKEQILKATGWILEKMHDMFAFVITLAKALLGALKGFGDKIAYYAKRLSIACGFFSDDESSGWGYSSDESEPTYAPSGTPNTSASSDGGPLYEMQSGGKGEMKGIMSFVASMITSVLPRSSYQEMSTSEKGKFTTFFSNVPASVKGVEYLLDKSNILADSLWFLITGDHFLGPQKIMQRLDLIHKKVKDVYCHLSSLGTNGIIPSHLVHVLNECDKDIRELHLESAGIDLPAHKRSMFKTTMDITGDLIKKTKLIAMQNKPRPQPVFVFLHGAPRQGKSEFAGALPSLVLERMAEICKARQRDNPYRLIIGSESIRRYPGHVFPDYWEGYVNQFSVCVEELYTSVDSEVSEKWSNQIMNFLNTYPVELNMAFEGKGQMYFTTPLVIATSNFEAHKIAVVDDGAYMRRVDFDLNFESFQTEGSTPFNACAMSFTDAYVKYAHAVLETTPNYCFDNAYMNIRTHENVKVSGMDMVDMIAKLMLDRHDRCENTKMPTLSALQPMKEAAEFYGYEAQINPITRFYHSYKEGEIYHAKRWCQAMLGFPSRDFYNMLTYNTMMAEGKDASYDLSRFVCTIIDEQIPEDIRVKDDILLKDLLLSNWKGDYVFRYDPSLLGDQKAFLKAGSDVSGKLLFPLTDQTFLGDFITSAVNAMNDCVRMNVDGEEFYHFAFISRYRDTLARISEKGRTLLFDIVLPEALLFLSRNYWEERFPFCSTATIPELITRHQYFKQLRSFYESNRLDKMKFVLCDVWNHRVSITTIAITVASMSALSYGLAQLFPGTYNAQYSDIPKDAPDKGRLKGLKHVASKAVKFKKVHKSKKVKDKEYQAQIANNEALISKVDRNVYTLHLHVDPDQVVGHIMMIEGVVGVINKHVWTSLPTDRFLMTNLILKESFDVCKDDCQILLSPDDKDILFIDFKQGFQSPSLRKYLMAYDEYPQDYSASTSALFYNPMACHDSRSDSYWWKSSWNVVGRPKIAPSSFTPTFAQDEYKTLSKLKYMQVVNYKNAGGWCGRPYIGSFGDKSIIFGIHTAALSSGSCLLSMVCRNDYDRAISNYDPYVAQVATFQMQFDEPLGMYKFDEGHISTPQTSTPYGKTVFVPTPFATHDGFKYPCPKKPAELSKRAYAKAHEKADSHIHCRNVGSRAHELLTSHGDEIMGSTNKLLNDVNSKNLKFISTETALWGDSTYERMDFSTSKGQRCRYFGISKKACAEPGPEADRLCNMVGKYWSFFMTGLFYFQIAAECLKDELRDLQRVAEYKTRIFYVTDFVDNILLKRIMAPIVLLYKQSVGLTEQACGINPASGFWRYYANSFKRYDTVVAADVSGWDFLQSPVIMRVIIKFISRFYSRATPNSNEFRMLTWAVMSCVHALRFSFKQGNYLGHGNTSGNYITTFLNTTAHELMKRSCFWMLAEDHNLNPSEALHTFTSVIYSDDNISASIFPWWTIDNYAKYMKIHFGANVTATDKSVNFRTGNIFDVDFLSRSFKRADWSEDVIQCPLSFDSVLAQLFYVRRASHGTHDENYMYKQLAVNIENVVRELREYDYDTAKEVIDAIENFVVMHDLPLLPIPRFTRLEQIEFKMRD